VRVTARLIDTLDGVQRWSDRYDRNARDVLQVQNEIAASLVSALQVEVAADVLFPLRSSRETSPAYDTYLRGLHAAYRFDQRGFEEAVAYCRHALELDPSFVAPAEVLAVVLDLLTEWQLVPPKIGFEQVRSAANIALKLDAESAMAHAILGNVHTYLDWDRSAATRESKTALAIAPKHPIVLIWAAKQRQVLGEWDEAMQLLNVALTVDPLQPGAYATRGQVYQRMSRLVEAERDYRRALEISPTYGRVRTWLGEVLLAEGKPEAALTEIEREAHLGNQLKGLAVVYYALHRTSDADAALTRLETTGATSSAMQIAQVYAFRGQKDAAFQWLHRAMEQKDVALCSIKGHPLLKNLEGDPRYKALLRKMNLPK
jgi:serine/threonine-protein kinase